MLLIAILLQHRGLCEYCIFLRWIWWWYGYIGIIISFPMVSYVQSSAGHRTLDWQSTWKGTARAILFFWTYDEAYITDRMSIYNKTIYWVEYCCLILSETDPNKDQSTESRMLRASNTYTLYLYHVNEIKKTVYDQSTSIVCLSSRCTEEYRITHIQYCICLSKPRCITAAIHVMWFPAAHNIYVPESTLVNLIIPI